MYIDGKSALSSSRLGIVIFKKFVGGARISRNSETSAASLEVGPILPMVLFFSFFFFF